MFRYTIQRHKEIRLNVRDDTCHFQSCGVGGLILTLGFEQWVSMDFQSKETIKHVLKKGSKSKLLY